MKPTKTNPRSNIFTRAASALAQNRAAAALPKVKMNNSPISTATTTLQASGQLPDIDRTSPAATDKAREKRYHALARTYSAMEAGPEKEEFYAKHKWDLFAANRMLKALAS